MINESCIESWKMELADATTQRIQYQNEIAFLLARLDKHEDIEKVLSDMSQAHPKPNLLFSEKIYESMRLTNAEVKDGI